MILAAKIISIILIIKGCLLLIFPSFIKKTAEGFNTIENSQKRSLGLLIIFIGAGLITLGRIDLTVPLVHWLVTVAGLLAVMEGLFLLIFPVAVGKVAVWFYREKGPTSLIGIILLAAGIVLYILI